LLIVDDCAVLSLQACVEVLLCGCPDIFLDMSHFTGVKKCEI